MGALRLARGWGARDLVLKFEGGYHGGHDALLFTTAGAPPEYLGFPVATVEACLLRRVSRTA
jgi:glutamate-1-semialdehyde aminotransferase